MSKPSEIFVSICVPTYKRTAYLCEALDSALNQRYSRFEIIVNDDTPTDEIKNIVESYRSDKIRYVRNNPPIGLSNKLNAFLKQARGEWMVIVCDDDYLDPDYLKVMTAHVRSFPDTRLIQTRYRLIDAAGRLIRNDRANPFIMNPFEYLATVCRPRTKSYHTNITGILFPRLELIKLGGFVPLSKAAGTDRLAWAVLGSQGRSICEPKPLATIRIHDEALSCGGSASCDNDLESLSKSYAMLAELLNKMESSAHNADDRKNLQDARECLHHFNLRHMRAIFDRSFMSALSNANGEAFREFKSLYKKMREHRSPFFTSLPAYLVLSFLPQTVRLPILKSLRAYKFKKWFIAH